jgi:CDP-diacylglycerol pyrophosphatase
VTRSAVRAAFAVLLVLFLIAALFVGRRALAADPDALWKIVHGQCAPHEASKGDPAPCLMVDLGGGYAVLKDIRGVTQVLVIPTARVTGIESPDLIASGAPNYFDDAWRARTFVEHLAGHSIPREDLALDVNSEDGRSQNQLHIHVDCLRPDVRDALRSDAGGIGPAWAPVPLPVTGRRYEAMRIDGAELADHDPFQLLAFGDQTARGDMSRETIVVAGVTGPGGAPGFVLLADRVNPATGDYGSGEELMDHDCKGLGPPAPPR